MKKFFKSLILGSALAVSLPAFAAEIDYGYVSKGASNLATAEVIFPSQPSSTIQLTSVESSGAANNATVVYFGGTARTYALSNATTSVTNVYVPSTNGFFTNGTAVVQASDGTCFAFTINGMRSNIVEATANFTVAITAGDLVFSMNKKMTNSTGATTLRKDGPAIFGAQLRNPAMVRSVGTNQTLSVTAHYNLNE